MFKWIFKLFKPTVKELEDRLDEETNNLETIICAIDDALKVFARGGEVPAFLIQYRTQEVVAKCMELDDLIDGREAELDYTKVETFHDRLSGTKEMQRLFNRVVDRALMSGAAESEWRLPSVAQLVADYLTRKQER